MAIANMNAPDSKTKLENFLGMVNYLAKVTAPLRILLKKGNDFMWDKAQENAF